MLELTGLGKINASAIYEDARDLLLRALLNLDTDPATAQEELLSLSGYLDVLAMFAGHIPSHRIALPMTYETPSPPTPPTDA